MATHTATATTDALLSEARGVVGEWGNWSLYFLGFILRGGHALRLDFGGPLSR
jgi:hypothetical protein